LNTCQTYYLTTVCLYSYDWGNVGAWPVHINHVPTGIACKRWQVLWRDI
jgi:hypothetical protein